YAFGIQEAFVDTGAHFGAETGALDGQGEGALYFFTSTYAARAHDALAGFEREVRVAFVFLGIEVVGTIVAVTHFAQAHRAGHVLQFAVAVGGAGQAVQRVIGDVELHHTFADFGDFGILGSDLQAWLNRRGAGGRH